MPPFPTIDRLVRKEVALGTIRELEPPTGHIGLRLIAPMQEVATDDVIFDYAKGYTQEGLAPARAEDAEAELAQKDTSAPGMGRASIIDWALKDHYTASDVTRYTDQLLLQQQAGTNGLRLSPLTINHANDFARQVAQDDALRRRKLDNRFEWLIMTSVETGAIAYNDGRIKFGISWGRPANQTDQAPAGGTWNLSTSDPIGDLMAVQEYMLALYGVRLTRAIASRKVIVSMMNSDRFLARFGPLVGGTPSSPIDLNYLANGWGPEAALAIVENATGIRFTTYDSVYRTRAIGSNTVTNNRFTSENKLFLLPSEEDIADLEDGMIGFGKTLTAPHPEGNWTPGFYEWEQETRDPWGRDRGTGIKAFPVLPHMDYTYTMTVLP